MMTTGLSKTTRPAFRTIAMRLIAVFVFALIALSTTFDKADAKGAPNSVQNGFTKACRDSGGRPERIGSRNVRCNLGDGSTITCNFNFDPPVCHYAVEGIVVWNETTPNPEVLIFEVTQAPVLDVSSPESGGSASDGAGQVSSGGILKKEQS